jgi:hypothetical protein
MRTVWIASALTLILSGATGTAVGATTPASPSVAACVAAWNASPGLKATHATRPAAVQALKANTFTTTWSKTSSVGMSGPGCIVYVSQPAGRALVVQRKWTTAGTTPWRRPIATTGLTSGRKFNAVLGPTGLLKLR